MPGFNEPNVLFWAAGLLPLGTTGATVVNWQVLVVVFHTEPFWQARQLKAVTLKIGYAAGHGSG